MRHARTRDTVVRLKQEVPALDSGFPEFELVTSDDAIVSFADDAVLEPDEAELIAFEAHEPSARPTGPADFESFATFDLEQATSERARAVAVPPRATRAPESSSKARPDATLLKAGAANPAALAETAPAVPATIGGGTVADTVHDAVARIADTDPNITVDLDALAEATQSNPAAIHVASRRVVMPESETPHETLEPAPLRDPVEADADRPVVEDTRAAARTLARVVDAPLAGKAPAARVTRRPPEHEPLPPVTVESPFIAKAKSGTFEIRHHEPRLGGHDESAVRARMTTWANRIAGYPVPNLGDAAIIRRLTTRHLYSYRQTVVIETRTVSQSESTLGRAKLPRRAQSERDVDRWRYRVRLPLDFTEHHIGYRLKETYEKVMCDRCLGEGRKTCDDCDGGRERSCARCAMARAPSPPRPMPLSIRASNVAPKAVSGASRVARWVRSRARRARPRAQSSGFSSSMCIAHLASRPWRIPLSTCRSGSTPSVCTTPR